MTPPMTPRELAASGHDMRNLVEQFGREALARLIDVEREVDELLARELSGADPDQRAWCAAHLALAVVTTGSWWAGISRERPAKQRRAARKAAAAARALLRALDDLPAGVSYGLHLRLLMQQLPPRLAREALHREMVWRTLGKVDLGLNQRRAGIAELVGALEEVGESMGAPDALISSRPETRIAGIARAAFEALGTPLTISGTGEGAWPRVIGALLALAGVHHVSAVDVARREAERRRAALHSGKNACDGAKISTGRAPKL
jgi:hypothetical protein